MLKYYSFPMLCKCAYALFALKFPVRLSRRYKKGLTSFLVKVYLTTVSVNGMNAMEIWGEVKENVGIAFVDSQLRFETMHFMPAINDRVLPLCHGHHSSGIILYTTNVCPPSNIHITNGGCWYPFYMTCLDATQLLWYIDMNSKENEKFGASFN